MRVLTTLGLVVSTALLARSLIQARRPVVVRELLDVARHVLQLAAVAAAAVVTGVRTATPLLGVCVVAGLAVGGVVGTSMDLSVRGARIVASRSLIGAALWGAGLVMSQVAGLADRAGVFRAGQAVSWFGLATAIGTFAGRRIPLGRISAQVGRGALTGLAVVVAIAIVTGDRRPPTVEAASADAVWVLDRVDREAMTTSAFTSLSHTPGAVDASIDVEGFGASFSATYDTPPNQLVPGDPLTLDVRVDGNASGVVQRFTGLAVIQLDSAGWTGTSVGVEANCIDPIGDASVSCTPPATAPGTFTYEVPSASPGNTFVVGVGVLNCSCGIFWVYSPGAAEDPATPGEAPSGRDENADAGTDDENTITPGEALGTSTAVVLVAVLIGLVDTRDQPADRLPPEVPGQPGEGRPGADTPRPPPEPAPRPPLHPPPIAVDIDDADALAGQAIRFAGDAIGPLVDYDRVVDQIRELQSRIRSGDGGAGDVELLRGLRDALWAIGQAERNRTLSAAARESAVLGALESLLAIEADVGKAAAGTFGPTSGAIYAGFVESVANRDKGLGAALGHGAVGGLVAFVGTPSGPAMQELKTAWTALRGGTGDAMQNAAEDLGHQLVDSGGDPTQIDLGRTAGSAVTGFVTGGARDVIDPHIRGTGPVPPPPPLRPPTAPAHTPPRLLPDDPVVPPRVNTTAAPADLFPDAPELPPAGAAWPRDASGRILDPGGGHLMTSTPDGLRAPDGAQIDRVITDGKGRPIGYETADGTQVISARQPDPSTRPTVHEGVPADPDEPPPTVI